MYVCMCVCVCMYVCMYVCKYVCMCVCVCVCVCALCSTDFTYLQIPCIHKFVKMTAGCEISHKNIRYTRYAK